MKHLIAGILMLFTLNAFAVVQVDTDGLTDAQKARLVQQVEQMKYANTSTEDTVEKVERWVNIGSQIGQGLAGAAKELGVAANEFAQTDVGHLATWLIVYHIVGHDALSFIIHVSGALFIWIVGLSLTHIIFNARRGVTIHYDKETGKQISVTKEPHRGFMEWWLSNAAIFIVGLVVLLTW